MTLRATTAENSAAADDRVFMANALAQAAQALAIGEVPVGAVVVRRGVVIAAAHNAPLTLHDPCAHAEILALRAAAQAQGNYRLDDCELFVTLEPCAMCAGAMLHARIGRLVFGAHEPKTGAAGSVLDLFALHQLNHQTRVSSGVMAAEAAQLLQVFFQSKRQEQRMTAQPVRDDALRTPSTQFDDLPGYPWEGQTLSDLPALAGLRMHYLDEQLDPPSGPGQSTGQGTGLIYLCLHGNPAWSYLYRRMIPIFLDSGARVVAPDLIGFGKSDKPKKDAFHSFTWHRQCLLEFVERLDLRRVVLVVQDWGGLLGLTLPMAAPERYVGLVVMNTALGTGTVPLSPGFLAWRDMCASNPQFNVGRLFGRSNPHLSPEECAAYNAPFPDPGHRAALRAFPPMVPEFADSDGAAISRAAALIWKNDWAGTSLMAIGMQDPVLGPPVMHSLRQQIRGCPQPIELAQAGHFVQELGEPIAHAAVTRFAHLSVAKA